MFIYPENLKAKPKLWLWQLRDISIIGICMILSALALAQGLGMAPLVLTFLYAIPCVEFIMRGIKTVIEMDDHCDTD